MKTSDFFYNLPQASIAQRPLKQRDQSKLMVLDRQKNTIAHQRFVNIIDYLKPGDCLVLNNTAVLPARLFGRRSSGARVEFLLLTEIAKDCWQCLVKPGRKARIGDMFNFSDQLQAEIIDIGKGGTRHVQFNYQGNFYDIIDGLGEMPLPPYINETLQDKDRYQTVYRQVNGSAAAPTAGLHFTETLLQKIEQKGVNIAHLTLHVGLGTFRPVGAENIEDHDMHAEWYELNEANAQLIAETKRRGGRVVAVGTTAVRTLESIYRNEGSIKATSGWTDIFIYPSYQFNAVDALITNFHLPESTLLMLVSAFYDRQKVIDAYQLAVEQNYRFFSFGDAMLIL